MRWAALAGRNTAQQQACASACGRLESQPRRQAAGGRCQGVRHLAIPVGRQARSPRGQRQGKHHPTFSVEYRRAECVDGHLMNPGGFGLGSTRQAMAPGQQNLVLELRAPLLRAGAVIVADRELVIDQGAGRLLGPR